MASIAPAEKTKKETSIVVALRIPRKLHVRLMQRAQKEDRSLASVIRMKLMDGERC